MIARPRNIKAFRALVMLCTLGLTLALLYLMAVVSASQAKAANAVIIPKDMPVEKALTLLCFSIGYGDGVSLKTGKHDVFIACRLRKDILLTSDTGVLVYE